MHNLGEVQLWVVDTAGGDGDGVAAEPRNRVAGHREVVEHLMDGLHRLVRRDLETCLDHVAVEDHVQVLVVGDVFEQLLRDRLGTRDPGVAVRDAGGQLLKGHVGHRVEQALGEEFVAALAVLAGGEAAGHLLHP
ncbi:Uncharacterised protein [Mycobacteroides abscessus subsp. abscessus]|nr:Uncharacterised protein [Mycobacteroides abscessus subsp. abscessus]